jgi:hypothetical protein
MKSELLSSLVHSYRDGRPVIIMPQLSASDYKKVDTFINAAGGIWNRNVGAHIFADGVDTKAAIAAAIKKNFHRDTNPADFFPTPPDIADRLIETCLTAFMRWKLDDDPSHKLRVLEPSAGKGDLLHALFRVVPRDRCEIVAFEIDERNQADLAAAGISFRGEDFLQAEIGEPVDIVLQNPPFSIPGCAQGWARHVLRAQSWLNKDGQLASIIPKLPTNIHGEALDVLAHANFSGTLEDLGLVTFRGNRGHNRETKIDVIIVNLEKDNYPPGTSNDIAISLLQNELKNRYEHNTAMIIQNNHFEKYSTLDRLVRNSGSTRDAVHVALAQRPDWIKAGAPWLTDRVDIKSVLTRLFHDFITEPERAETHVPKTPSFGQKTSKVPEGQSSLFARTLDA